MEVAIRGLQDRIPSTSHVYHLSKSSALDQEKSGTFLGGLG